MAAADPATTSTFQAGGRNEDNKGEKGVSPAESVIFLKGFPGSLFFFFFAYVSLTRHM